jgi:hypothetical protein
LRELYCYNKFPDFQMVENCLASEVEAGEMRVTPDLKKTCKSVKVLRKLLLSDRLYANKVVYSKISEGLESGKFRSVQAQGPRPLPELLTIAHEAYFRLTLYMTMSVQGYRDHTGDADARMDLYHNLCASVKRDRDANATAAWEQREQNLHTNSGSGEEDDDDEGAPSNRVTIADEYY